jgi:hypothetical protein
MSNTNRRVEKDSRSAPLRAGNHFRGWGLEKLLMQGPTQRDAQRGRGHF